jgi:hypothetical protein
MNTLNNWFWGTTPNTGIIECDSRQKNSSTRNKGKYTNCRSISYDPNISKQQTISVVSQNSLKNKVKLLSKFYEVNYEMLLKTPKFWNELQKIKDFESRNSYHDIFIDKIVGSTEPLSNKELVRYADVIETVYIFACPLMPTKECEKIMRDEEYNNTIEDHSSSGSGQKIFEPEKNGFGFILF